MINQKPIGSSAPSPNVSRALDISLRIETKCNTVVYGDDNDGEEEKSEANVEVEEDDSGDVFIYHSRREFTRSKSSKETKGQARFKEKKFHNTPRTSTAAAITTVWNSSRDSQTCYNSSRRSLKCRVK